MVHRVKTYRFTFDYRKLGTSRTGLKTYEIRNIPEWETRSQLVYKMPHPPEHEFHLDYCNKHLWN